MRVRYIVDLRLQLKYAVLIITPILLLGFFSVTVGFKVAKEMISQQRQQLMLQIAALEETIKSIEGGILDKPAADRVLERIKRLKGFAQDLVAFNIYEVRRLSQMIFLVVVILVFGSLAFGLIISHRISGPVYRLEKIVQQIIKGERLDAIRTRSTDEFKQLAGVLEELRLKLVNDASTRKESVTNLLVAIDEIRDKFDKGALGRQDFATLSGVLSELEKQWA